ncbi:hypothetical protein O3P69_008570 [Scylla paramamosain]|uniref:Uncharacterized protein n=1 Tax=Scylla paramamosain TaxID=85552 RepID=A0AAW0SLH9_SCYPA
MEVEMERGRDVVFRALVAMREFSVMINHSQTRDAGGGIVTGEKSVRGRPVIVNDSRPRREDTHLGVSRILLTHRDSMQPSLRAEEGEGVKGSEEEAQEE